MKKKYLGRLGMIMAFLALILIPFKSEAKENNEALSGIVIDDMPVSGMTEQQISELLQDKIADQRDQAVILDYSDIAQISVSAGELGLSWGNPAIAKEIVSLGKSGNIIFRRILR